MKSLADLFRERVEDWPSEVWSANLERIRRKPIDEAVARVIEAADKHFMACKPKTKYDLTELSAFADLYEALTALRKALD